MKKKSGYVVRLTYSEGRRLSRWLKDYAEIMQNAGESIGFYGHSEKEQKDSRKWIGTANAIRKWLLETVDSDEPRPFGDGFCLKKCRCGTHPKAKYFSYGSKIMICCPSCGKHTGKFMSYDKKELSEAWNRIAGSKVKT